ncbi:hypothetical protein R3P38DRAFT_3324066 [Favolaschia claudopus]|uniref:Uncharacterized protein n=1 Tax=Favolaschia claudopus TaxID=2862362 RepID=A0AAW0AJL1_9AGAR
MSRGSSEGESKTLKEENPRLTMDEMATKLKAWLDEQPGDKMNPLLDIAGLDPSQDTPVELLHTILLGVIKYIWHHMNTNRWSDSDRHLLAIRLQTTDLSGLTVPPLRAGYMMQYRKNLIGKHFKTLMQVLTFHVHEMASPDEFSLIKAAGELGARLWVPEIDDMDQYLADLKVAIANLLDAFDAVEPLRILTKIKLHLLAHIPDDVRRFGPLIRSSTEIYESYNTVFRLCSVLSNHLAPSRDISRKFSSMSRVKHLLSGGYWKDSHSNWINSGEAVKDALQTDIVLQRHLGWVSHKQINPGTITPVALKRKPAFEWAASAAAKQSTLMPPDSVWRAGRSLTTRDGDQVSVGSWVVAKHEGKMIFGRIQELLVGKKHLVNLEQFKIGANRHPVFDWPVLRRPNGTEIVAGAKSFIVLEGSSHDCRQGHCKPAVVGKQRQERQETTQDKSLIRHTDDDHFILNMSGLHNFVKICRTLPHSLTDVRPLHPADRREQFHNRAAEKVRVARDKSRKKTAAKRRETAAAKRKDAEVAASAAQVAEESAQRAENAVTRGEEIPDDTVDSDQPQEDDSENEEGAEEGDDDAEWVPRGTRSRPYKGRRV